MIVPAVLGVVLGETSSAVGFFFLLQECHLPDLFLMLMWISLEAPHLHSI